MLYNKRLLNVNDAINRYKIVPTVTLVGVSKTLSLTETENAVLSGINNLGENRIQSAEEKIQLLKNKYSLTWHFIGTIQKNKLRKIVELFDFIHSVDRLEYLPIINKLALEFNKTIKILLQINVSGELSKHGFSKKDIKNSNLQLNDYSNIEFEGYMTMAPNINDEGILRNYFKDLKSVAEELKDEKNINYKHLSMGMSNDYIYALQEGATIIRLGTILFS
ncbi:MAG: YggS family pyridoxal phosphate enzyme [Candidatus Margulisbacteria bacterium GWF2_35_9]|nr:MAG: YggS family pyridoxal phosphate enzyme [Candidatus Margulisbacteria bacterium GWF2_35_9]